MSELSLSVLLPLALSGTQKAQLPTFQHPNTPLLAQLQAQAHPKTATQLLRLGVVCLSYERLSYQAPAVPKDFEALRLPQHTQNSAASLSPHLQTLLPKPILSAWWMMLQDLAQRHLHLPAHLLVDFLSLARKDSALRTSLHPVLGPQGLFLAQQNPDWKFANGISEQASDEDTWQYGNHLQRVQVLTQQRQRDPEGARVRLQDALNQKTLKVAKERLQMLEVMRHNLSADDEALLEQCLDDRSGEVLALAAELLSALPNSAHSQRMSALLPLLVQQNAQGAWLLEPLAIEAAQSSWQRDGIVTTPPKYNRLSSPKAWLLYQMVRMIPLSTWQTHTGMNLDQLLSWAKKSEAKTWQDALQAAWYDAIRISGLPNGLDDLTASLTKKLRQQQLLLPLLLQWPMATCEQFWRQHVLQFDDLQDIIHISQATQAPLSEAFSKFVIQCFTVNMNNIKAQDAKHHHAQYFWISQARDVLTHLVWMLHPDVFAQLRSLPWPQPLTPETSDSWSECERQTIAAIDVRARWQQALHAHPISPIV